VIVTTVAGNEMKMPAQNVEHPAKIDKGDKGEGDETLKPKKLGEGTEQMEVKGKKIEAQWVKMEIEHQGNTTVSTAWTSDDIPNQTVKMISETTGGVATTTEMILVDLNADRK